MSHSIYIHTYFHSNLIWHIVHGNCRSSYILDPLPLHIVKPHTSTLSRSFSSLQHPSSTHHLSISTFIVSIHVVACFFSPMFFSRSLSLQNTYILLHVYMLVWLFSTTFFSSHFSVFVARAPLGIIILDVDALSSVVTPDYHCFKRSWSPRNVRGKESVEKTDTHTHKRKFTTIYC